jgi:cation transport regulator ChaB
MPKMSRDGKPRESELPSTLKKSSPKAQRTFAKSHDAAVQEYGEGERAHRVAFASLKHSFEKVDDRWVTKRTKGPSDAQDAKTGAAARRGGPTAGGVDVLGHTRDELLERARVLGITGRHRMNKEELGRAIARAQARPASRRRSRSRSRS